MESLIMRSLRVSSDPLFMFGMYQVCIHKILLLMEYKKDKIIKNY
jgi:hypothetical protein